MVESVFIIKDCALAAISTGEKASRLDEFRDKLIHIPLSCIYHHFWGGLLHMRFAHPDYHNDFSAWAHQGLHDSVLAERLNILDPTRFKNLEDLRQEVIEIVEQRLDEQALVPVAKDHRFHFIRSKTIIFDTHQRLHHPVDLAKIAKDLSFSCIFYHFIEARRREPIAQNDFSNWLLSFGNEYKPLIEELKMIDPFFRPLSEIKKELVNVFSNYFPELS
jgi:hypothetical protein